MYNYLIHRVVILLGCLASIISFIWNIHIGSELLHCAWISFCVGLATAIILLVAIKTIANILFQYLKDQKDAHNDLIQQENNNK